MRSFNRLIDRQKVINITEYVYVILLILGSRSQYAHPMYGDYRITELFAVVSVVLFLLKFRLLDGLIKLNRRIFLLLWIYFPMMAVYALLNVENDALISFIGRYFIIVPASILIFDLYNQEHDTHNLLSKFVDLMSLLSIVSIFFWLTGSLLGIIKPSGYFESRWGSYIQQMIHRSFYGVYFDRQKENFFNFSGYRNCGLFTEAPMHAMMLLFAVGAELFYLKREQNWRKLFKIGLLSFTVFSTFSSTGIILAIFFLALYFFTNLPQNNKIRIAVLVFSIPIAWIMGLISYTVFETKSLGTVSWTQRMNGTTTALSYFLKSPLIGTGYNGEDFRQALVGDNFGFSFSFAAVLSEGGILLSSVYWVPIIYAIVTSLRYHEINITFFVMIYVIQFCSSLCENALIIFVLLGAFITYIPAREKTNATRLQPE